jgi:hypothetical protein
MPANIYSVSSENKPMSTNEFDIPEEINVYKQIWRENPEEVIYSRGEVAEDDEY